MTASEARSRAKQVAEERRLKLFQDRVATVEKAIQNAVSKGRMEAYTFEEAMTELQTVDLQTGKKHFIGLGFDVRMEKNCFTGIVCFKVSWQAVVA